MVITANEMHIIKLNLIMKVTRSRTTLLHPPRHLFLWLAGAITLCPFKRKEIKGGSEARRDYFLTALTTKTLFVRNGWVCILEWTFSNLRQDAHCREKLLETRFRRTMLQLNDTVEPESPGAAVLHPAETEEGVEVAFTPPEAGRSLGHGSSVACCPPLQTLTPFHVHNPTVQAKVKDYFVFRVSESA